VRNRAIKAAYFVAVAVGTIGWLWLLVMGAEAVFGF
jgi:hypothetical protein